MTEKEQTWGAPPAHPKRRWTARTTAVAALVGVGIAGASGLAVWAADGASESVQSGTGGPPGMTRSFGPMQESLHGRYVVAEGDGYRTELTQTGTVTAISGTSLTVRSDDGYTKSYKITSDTDGAEDVEKGSEASVVATLKGKTATATSVTDAAARGSGGRDGFPDGKPGDGGRPGGFPGNGGPPGGNSGDGQPTDRGRTSGT